MKKWKLVSITLFIIIASYLLLHYINYLLYNINYLLYNISFVTITSTEYKQNPTIGNYAFIISSGIASENILNKNLITSYVYINLSKVKPGDNFLIYPPINSGSKISKAFYSNPIINVTILNSTIFYSHGDQYINFGIKVYITAYKKIAQGCVVSIIGIPLESFSSTELSCGTNLYIGFKAVNASVFELMFFVANCATHTTSKSLFPVF
jgi:hypothetical protein